MLRFHQLLAIALALLPMVVGKLLPHGKAKVYVAFGKPVGLRWQVKAYIHGLHAGFVVEEYFINSKTREHSTKSTFITVGYGKSYLSGSRWRTVETKTWIDEKTETKTGQDGKANFDKNLVAYCFLVSETAKPIDLIEALKSEYLKPPRDEIPNLRKYQFQPEWLFVRSALQKLSSDFWGKESAERAYTNLLSKTVTLASYEVKDHMGWDGLGPLNQ